METDTLFKELPFSPTPSFPEGSFSSAKIGCEIVTGSKLRTKALLKTLPNAVKNVDNEIWKQVIPFLDIKQTLTLSSTSSSFYILSKLQKWTKISTYSGGIGTYRRSFWLNYLMRIDKLSEFLHNELSTKYGDHYASFIAKQLAVTPSNPVTIYQDSLTHRAQYEFLNKEILLSDKIKEEIKLDISRTFPTVERYKKPNGEGQQSLFAILCCLAKVNPDVGYCQGMNFIVGTLLDFFDGDETNAFFSTVFILRLLDYRNIFSSSIPLLPLKLHILNSYANDYFPDLVDHLNNFSLRIDFLSQQWFLTLFSYTEKGEDLYRIWDCIFYDGWKAIMKFSLHYLHEVKAQLMRCFSIEECMTVAHSKKNYLIEQYSGEGRSSPQHTYSTNCKLYQGSCDKYSLLNNQTTASAMSREGGLAGNCNGSSGSAVEEAITCPECVRIRNYYNHSWSANDIVNSFHVTNKKMQQLSYNFAYNKLSPIIMSNDDRTLKHVSKNHYVFIYSANGTKNPQHPCPMNSCKCNICKTIPDLRILCAKDNRSDGLPRTASSPLCISDVLGGASHGNPFTYDSLLEGNCSNDLSSGDIVSSIKNIGSDELIRSLSDSCIVVDDKGADNYVPIDKLLELKAKILAGYEKMTNSNVDRRYSVSIGSHRVGGEPVRGLFVYYHHITEDSSQNKKQECVPMLLVQTKTFLSRNFVGEGIIFENHMPQNYSQCVSDLFSRVNGLSYNKKENLETSRDSLQPLVMSKLLLKCQLAKVLEDTLMNTADDGRGGGQKRSLEERITDLVPSMEDQGDKKHYLSLCSCNRCEFLMRQYTPLGLETREWNESTQNYLALLKTYSSEMKENCDSDGKVYSSEFAKKAIRPVSVTSIANGDKVLTQSQTLLGTNTSNELSVDTNSPIEPILEHSPSLVRPISIVSPCPSPELKITGDSLEGKVDCDAKELIGERKESHSPLLFLDAPLNEALTNSTSAPLTSNRTLWADQTQSRNTTNPTQEALNTQVEKEGSTTGDLKSRNSPPCITGVHVQHATCVRCCLCDIVSNNQNNPSLLNKLYEFFNRSVARRFSSFFAAENSNDSFAERDKHQRPFSLQLLHDLPLLPNAKNNQEQIEALENPLRIASIDHQLLSSGEVGGATASNPEVLTKEYLHIHCLNTLTSLLYNFFSAKSLCYSEQPYEDTLMSSMAVVSGKEYISYNYRQHTIGEILYRNSQRYTSLIDSLSPKLFNCLNSDFYAKMIGLPLAEVNRYRMDDHLASQRTAVDTLRLRELLASKEKKKNINEKTLKLLLEKRKGMSEEMNDLLEEKAALEITLQTIVKHEIIQGRDANKEEALLAEMKALAEEQPKNPAQVSDVPTSKWAFLRRIIPFSHVILGKDAKEESVSENQSPNVRENDEISSEIIARNLLEDILSDSGMPARNELHNLSARSVSALDNGDSTQNLYEEPLDGDSADRRDIPVHSSELRDLSISLEAKNHSSALKGSTEDHVEEKLHILDPNYQRVTQSTRNILRDGLAEEIELQRRFILKRLINKEKQICTLKKQMSDLESESTSASDAYANSLLDLKKTSNSLHRMVIRRDKESELRMVGLLATSMWFPEKSIWPINSVNRNFPVSMDSAPKVPYLSQIFNFSGYN